MSFWAGAIVTFDPGATLGAATQAQLHPDQELTAALVAHAHPDHDVVRDEDTVLSEGIETGHATLVSAGVWPGMSVLCSPDLSDSDHPGELDLTLVTHPSARRSVLSVYTVDSVGAAGFALWDGAGRLVRAISLAGSPAENEVYDDVGARLLAEEPWWSDPDGYAPDLPNLVMRDLVGFDYGYDVVDPPMDLDRVPVLRFATSPRDTPRARSPQGPPALPLPSPAPQSPPPPAAAPPAGSTQGRWWRRR